MLKKIFGSEAYKECALSLLNASLFLKGKKKICDLEFLSIEYPLDIELQRTLIDVCMQEVSGKRSLAQIQMVSFEDLDDRWRSRVAGIYEKELAKRGVQNLRRDLLSIVSEPTLLREKSYKWESSASDNPELSSLGFTHGIWIELPRFVKTLEEVTTLEEAWYYFLKHAGDGGDLQSLTLAYPEVKRAHEALSSYLWSEEELTWYEELIMREADMRGVIAARKEEEEKAFSEGFREEERRVTLQIAKKLVKDGIAKKDIIAWTGLSEEEVDRLKRSSP